MEFRAGILHSAETLLDLPRAPAICFPRRDWNLLSCHVIVRRVNPLVSVIIVNYNGQEFLGPSLQSVLAQTYRPIELIVVDNASRDGSVAFVREKFPDVLVLESSVNLGFAGGNNLGWSRASGELVALLNSDAVADPRWLETLVTTLLSEDLALACSLVLTEGVPAQHYARNGTLNFIGYNIMEAFTDLSMVFYGSAAALLVRRDAVDTPFPEEYFLYQEDVYLSWLLRLKRQRIAMVQASVVRHLGSASTEKQPSSLVTFYQERNRLLNCLAFYEPETLVRLVPYFVLDAVTKTVLSLASRRKSVTGIVRAYLWIAAHPRQVLALRSRVQRKRETADNDILRLMSHRVVNGHSLPARWVNSLSRGYAALVGLKHHG